MVLYGSSLICFWKRSTWAWKWRHSSSLRSWNHRGQRRLPQLLWLRLRTGESDEERSGLLATPFWNGRELILAFYEEGMK